MREPLSVSRLADIIEWVYTKRIAMRGAKSWTEHHAIVEAIADGDPEQAAVAACAHIANARAAYVDIMLDHA